MDDFDDDGFAQLYRVELQPRPYESHIRHVGEDWAGVTNQVERKKLQNRLNKRICESPTSWPRGRHAHDDPSARQRKRKNDAGRSARGPSRGPARSRSISSRSSPTTDSTWDSPSPADDDAAAAWAPLSGPADCTSSLQSTKAVVCPLRNLIASFSHCSAQTIGYKRAILHQFAEHALRSYATADPCADHALRLIQLNIINGLTGNARALGFQFDWLICEVISPFGRHGSVSEAEAGVAAAAAVPGTLVPTSLQLRTRHHPWIDLFPLPSFRDSLLMAAQILPPEREQELYDDILESGGGRGEWAGLAIWGDPWDPRSWEVSVPFLKKWGWLLKACPEILEATNYWRRTRGEEPIAYPGCVGGVSKMGSRFLA